MLASIELENRSRLRFKAISQFLPVLLGTVLEYYDYALYGFCASVLSQHFFPSDDPTVSMLKVFGIFLSGSLAKPLGAILFGTIGDRFGRRLALKISILGIAIPTVIIGCMPTYGSIGWIAPLVLLLCRTTQGVFTAGESDGARVFLFESIGRGRPFLANSLVGLACLSGIYIASSVTAWALSLNFSDAWRLPFLLGGLMGFLVFLARYSLPESSDYLAAIQKINLEPVVSFWRVLRQNKKFILAAILLCGAGGGTYHFYLVFFGNYLSTILNIFDEVEMVQIISNAVLIFTVSGPLSGLLADRYGAMKVMTVSLIILFGLTLCNMVFLEQGLMPVWLIMATTVMVSMFQSPGLVVLLQKFKTTERYRSVSIGHAIGSMLFSGTAPFIGFWCWHKTGVVGAPFIYFILLIILGFISVFLLKTGDNIKYRLIME